MTLPLVDFALWIGGSVLELTIAVAMVRRRLVRQYPAFFCSIVFLLVRFVGLFIVLHAFGRNSKEYFFSYWSAQAISIGLTFTAIHEIYQAVFKGYDAFQRLGAALFRWSGVVLLLVAVGVAASSSSSEAIRAREVVFVLERSVRIVQCGLLLLLFVVSSYLALSWRDQVFGLALGFGIFGAVELAAASIRAQLGVAVNGAWSRVNAAAFFCALIVWLSYFAARQPVVARAVRVPRTEIEKWNQALLQLIQR